MEFWKRDLLDANNELNLSRTDDSANEKPIEITKKNVMRPHES